MLMTWLSSLLLVLAGAAVLFLPGAIWVAWVDSPARRDPAVKLADAAGFSLAFTALAALILFGLNLRLTHSILILIYIFCAAVVILSLARRKSPEGTSPITWILAVAAILIAVGWRLYQARTLAFPAWVDSLHHTLITRVILEQGGLPANLQPYIDVPFFYHYVFHVLAAAFSSLGEVTPDRAVLWLGQGISALVGLSVYRLGKTIWKDVRPAAFAAVLVTFFAQMPAYYLTWGRYTLLTGLVIMPLAASAAVETAHDETRTPESITRLATLTAGTLLCHYLAAILLAFFLAALAVVEGISALRARRWQRDLWLYLVGAPLLGLLVALPWLLRIFQYQPSYASVEVLTTATKETWQYIGKMLGPRRDWVLIITGGLGLLWAMRSKQNLPLMLWSLMLGLFSLPLGIKLGPFRPDLYAIVLFMPASLLAGNLFTSLANGFDWLTEQKRWGWVALGVLAAVCIVWGGLETRNILNPTTIIANAADRKALDYIQEKTPPDARFWMNTTLWISRVYRGVDGGAWIMPYTGRWSIVPTSYYGFGSQGTIEEINQRAAAANRLTTCTPEFYDWIEAESITHIYVREGVGSLQPDGLNGCPRLNAVYHEDGVWIYAVE
jgi:Ca2+/Na+ antiporter